jgi:protein farnesyltransferase subunit beta
MQQLASTYAAVLALVILGTQEAYEIIDRQGMYRFLMAVKNIKDGSFRMALRGETDLRGSYIAVVLAELLNLWTPELRGKSDNYYYLFSILGIFIYIYIYK